MAVVLQKAHLLEQDRPAVKALRKRCATTANTSANASPLKQGNDGRNDANKNLRCG